MSATPIPLLEQGGRIVGVGDVSTPFIRLKAILLDAFQRTLRRARREHLDMHTAALMVGVARVTEAKLLRGLFP